MTGSLWITEAFNQKQQQRHWLLPFWLLPDTELPPAELPPPIAGQTALFGLVKRYPSRPSSSDIEPGSGEKARYAQRLVLGDGSPLHEVDSSRLGLRTVLIQTIRFGGLSPPPNLGAVFRAGTTVNGVEFSQSGGGPGFPSPVIDMTAGVSDRPTDPVVVGRR